MSEQAISTHELGIQENQRVEMVLDKISNKNTLTIEEVTAALESVFSEVATIQKHALDYETGKTYPFLRLTSPDLQVGDKVIMIGAGVHANELAGLVAMLRYGKELFDYAHEHGVKLIVYPCRNPSGLEKVQGYPDSNPEHRYNILDDRGEETIQGQTEITGNNALLWHKVGEKYIGDMGANPGEGEFFWPSGMPMVQVPLETETMEELVQADISKGIKIVGVIDCHQDLISDFGPGSYFYHFLENSKTYQNIILAIEALKVKMFQKQDISAGFTNGEAIKTDEQGGIVRYDGSWPEAMYRFAHCPHCITPETTGAVPLEVAAQINLIWVKGIIDLASAAHI